jgi:arylsulfatase A-like enzyme
MKTARFFLLCKMKIICFAFLLLFSCSSPHDETQKPNIILFLVDDLGWQDTSLPFHSTTTAYNKRYQTPNMARLANAGMKFTQAYASCVCSPSRISLMTGMNAARHRVTNWTLRKDLKTDAFDSIIQPPNWNFNGLNTEAGVNNTVVATTLPNLLRQEDYFTIHIGKAHFAAIDTPCSDPLNCGFDINVAGHAAGAPGSYSGLNNFGNKPDGSPKGNWSVPGLEKYHGQDINLTEALTLEAKSILDTVLNRDQPFYLYMSHYTVHSPIQADKRFFQQYIDQGLDTIEARYASMVEGMDKSLGDLMDYLEEKQISDNTVILFMSDNGGLSAVARGGQAHTHNAPLASGKGSAYEGGVREPMIVKWPEKVAANSVCDQYVIIEDFFPTVLALANIEAYETVQEVDGKSFTELLFQEESSNEPRPIYWHYPNIWGPTGGGIGAYSAIREGNWKLIYYHKDTSFELYDLEHDIGENNNLASLESDKRKRLSSLLANYLRDVDAQMPKSALTGEQVLWPDQLD